MDLTHVLDSEIYVLSCCQADDGADLVALGGEHSVHVVQIVREINPLFAPHLIARTDRKDDRPPRRVPPRRTRNSARMVHRLRLALRIR